MGVNEPIRALTSKQVVNEPDVTEYLQLTHRQGETGQTHSERVDGADRFEADQ